MRTNHEVEPGHQQHHVDQDHPVLLQRDLAFGDEGVGDIAARFADSFALKECLGLRKTETEDDK
jgi:hypothetical protein